MHLGILEAGIEKYNNNAEPIKWNYRGSSYKLRGYNSVALATTPIEMNNMSSCLVSAFSFLRLGAINTLENSIL